MNTAAECARPNKQPSCYAVRARSRRAEAATVQAAAAGRCACGQPATCGRRCQGCEETQKAAGRAAFVGL